MGAIRRSSRRERCYALVGGAVTFAVPFAGSIWLYVTQRYFAQYAVSARFPAATFAIFAVASFHLPVVDIVFTPITEVLMVELGKSFRRAPWDDAEGLFAPGKDYLVVRDGTEMKRHLSSLLHDGSDMIGIHLWYNQRHIRRHTIILRIAENSHTSTRKFDLDLARHLPRQGREDDFHTS